MKSDVERLVGRIKVFAVLLMALRVALICAAIWGGVKLVRYVQAQGGLARVLGTFVAEFNDAREGR